jgi:dihydrolipoamide dehydrogenase
MQEFDLIVIGGGPGGYTGAIRASQLGMRVACIEKHKTLGGNYLNTGCIPLKSLLHFSEKFAEAKNHFSDIGVKTTVKLNLKKMLSSKDKSVDEQCKGIEFLLKKNKITRFHGTGRIISNNAVEITNGNNSNTIKGKKILIATGSGAASIPGVIIDEKKSSLRLKLLKFQSYQNMLPL